MGKNDWFTKAFMPSKFIHVAMKKIKSFCKTKHPTKNKSKNTKEKRTNGLMTIKVYFRLYE